MVRIKSPSADHARETGESVLLRWTWEYRAARVDLEMLIAPLSEARPAKARPADLIAKAIEECRAPGWHLGSGLAVKLGGGCFGEPFFAFEVDQIDQTWCGPYRGSKKAAALDAWRRVVTRGAGIPPGCDPVPDSPGTYAVRCGDMVKIGRSDTSIRRRVLGFRTANPFRMSLIAWHPRADMERIVQGDMVGWCWADKGNGEWFMAETAAVQAHFKGCGGHAVNALIQPGVEPISGPLD